MQALHISWVAKTGIAGGLVALAYSILAEQGETPRPGTAGGAVGWDQDSLPELWWQRGVVRHALY